MFEFWFDCPLFWLGFFLWGQHVFVTYLWLQEEDCKAVPVDFPSCRLAPGQIYPTSGDKFAHFSMPWVGFEYFQQSSAMRVQCQPQPGSPEQQQQHRPNLLTNLFGISGVQSLFFPFPPENPHCKSENLVKVEALLAWLSTGVWVWCLSEVWEVQLPAPCHNNERCSRFSTFLFLTGCVWKLTSHQENLQFCLDFPKESAVFPVFLWHACQLCFCSPTIKLLHVEPFPNTSTAFCIHTHKKKESSPGTGSGLPHP